MQKALLIAEKPSLKGKIEKVYADHKSEFDFELTALAQRGHLVRLLEPKEVDPVYLKWDINTLPYVPEKEGGWQYVVSANPDSASRFKAIEKALNSGEYDFIIHAGDTDQEGELLVRLVLNKLNNTLPVKRLWSDFETEASLYHALKNLRDDSEPQFENLYKAALIRQHSDHRFGMNGSIAAGDKFGVIGASVGRCKSAILNMVVIRCDEIKNFVPKTVYGVKVTYSNNLEGIYFDDTVETEQKDADKKDTEKRDSTIYFENKQDAVDFIKTLSSSGTVIDVKSERKNKYAPRLFNLDGVQSEAFKIGYGLKDTLEIIQELYEAGYVSYPRTDCYHLSTDTDVLKFLNSAKTVPGLQTIINSITPAVIDKVKKMKQYFNDESVKNHGHGALTPSDVAPEFSKLTKRQQDIYELICQRFVTIFMEPLVQDYTYVVTEINGNKFKSSGKMLVSKGWTELLGMDIKEKSIPAAAEGDVLTVSNTDTFDKTSVCPKYFTEETLSQAMSRPFAFLEDKSLKSLGENFQIGRPSTKSKLLEDLFKKGYLVFNKKNIIPTPVGEYLCRNMRVTSLGKIDTTGLWEVKMEKVRQGTASFEDVDQEMRNEVAKMVNDIKNAAIIGTNPSKSSSGICKCPSCGGTILAGTKSYYCSNYKTGCKVTIWKNMIGANITENDAKNLLSGKTIKKKLKSNAGKTWEQELIYDRTDNKVQFAVSQPKAVAGLVCPMCGKDMTLDDKTCKCQCGLTIWRTIAEKKLTDSQIKQLIITGKTDKISGFKSKTGKNFNASIRLENGKTQFDFN